MSVNGSSKTKHRRATEMAGRWAGGLGGEGKRARAVVLKDLLCQ